MSAYLWRPARRIGAYALEQVRVGVSVAGGIPLAEIAAAKRLSLSSALSGLKELISAGYAVPCWPVDDRPGSALQFRPTAAFLRLCRGEDEHRHRGEAASLPVPDRLPAG